MTDQQQTFKEIDERKTFVETPQEVPSRGHKEAHRFPLFLRFAWTVFLSWGIFYVIKFSLPDLMQWFGK